MYKHVSKQRKLADQKKQVVLSDESDDSDDEVDNLSSASSGSESGSGSEEEESGDEDEEEEDEEEEQEQVALKPPPASYLTVAEALKDPIVYPVEAGGDATDPEVVCVVCTDKALKKGKMLDVHLASNGHKRRLKRFTIHCTAASFPSTSLTVDARTIAAQIDTKVNSTISTQAQFGASASITPAQLAELESKSRQEGIDTFKLKAAVERRSVRAVLREERIARNVANRVRRKEKKARADEEPVSGVTIAEKVGLFEGKPVTGKQMDLIIKAGVREIRKKSGLGKSQKVQPPKPTPEEIALRQAAKLAKRAEAAASISTTSDSPKTATSLPKKGPTTKKRKTRGNKAPSGKHEGEAVAV